MTACGFPSRYCPTGRDNDHVPARNRFVALAVTSACLAAACTGGASSAGKPTGGQPIVIGLINTEDAPVGSFPDLRRGALAAQTYVNDTLGGVRGRPIQIVACATSGTPESSQACANRLLARHPVAVIGGVDLGAAASLPPLQSAGVPYVGGSPAATEALTSSGSYMLTGGTATEVLGEVAYAVDTLHVTRMAAVYSDVPGLLSTAAEFLKTIVRKKGVTHFQLFPVEQGAPDVVPALSAAAATHPQAVIAIFPAQACTRVVQGVAAIDLKACMMYPSFCAVDSVLAAGGTSSEGSVFATGLTPYVEHQDHDVSVYLSAIKRDDPGLGPSLLSEAGFSDVVALRQLLAAVSGSLTPSALTAQLRSTRDHPGFLSHSFSCDGAQIPLLPALCNAYVQVSVVSHGHLQPVGGWVDTAPTAALATS
jgi:branched-chain amino acid transport system substrate-binding protein